jgi:hypothetical protein
MLRSMIAASAALAGGAHAFWRMECPGRVGLARIDPLVSPGVVSQHAHAIHGSSGFSTTATTQDLLNGDCTSCRVTQDKSSYWHPAAYFQDAETGEFEVVEQVGGMLAYYLLDGNNVTAFPPDFRMISGTSTKRSYKSGNPDEPDPEKSSWGNLDQETLAERAVGFNCLNYGKAPEGTLYRHFLPEKSYLDANCADGVRFELMFPTCWDGVNTDSESHKDHVAFPSLVMNGECPEGYPVRLPGLLFEVIWATNALAGRNGKFVIANGDPTGYGFHGDFIMGWEGNTLDAAVEQCTSLTGRIEDCPVFDIIDENTAKQCKLDLPKISRILSEDKVEGPLPMLPGDVQVTYDEVAAENPVLAPPPASTELPSPVPTLPYTPGETPSAGAAPLPGQVFKETEVVVEEPAPSSSTISAPAVNAAAAPADPTTVEPPPEPITTEPPVVTTPTDTASYFSTQYITEGNVVSKILWEEELVYVTEIQPVTTTVVVPAPAERRRRREAHMHRHGHHH